MAEFLKGFSKIFFKPWRLVALHIKTIKINIKPIKSRSRLTEKFSFARLFGRFHGKEIESLSQTQIF